MAEEKPKRKKRMTKQDLVEELRRVKREYQGDTEAAHSRAEELLLDYINDDEVREAFDAIGGWYA